MELSEIIQISLLSLRVSISAVFLSTIIGVFLGILIATSNFRFRGVLVTLINTFMGTPPVLLGLILYLAFSRVGPLGFLGLLFTPEAMIISQFLLTLPIVIGLTISAIESLPRDLLEFISSVSIKALYKFIFLVNEAKIGILASVLAALGRAVSEVGAVIIVGGNIRYYTRVLTTAIVFYTSAGDFDSAIILGLILIAIYFAINVSLLYFRLKMVVRYA
ncbi:MAG: ABC transporter permease [archaeon YNP-WB-040]|nr:ABC transporter permease [Candidatus Culexarchaeum yellowstonense]